MFDVSEFNITLGVLSLFTIFLSLSFLFKSKLSTFFDPLNYHLFWISAHFAFFIIYVERYGSNIFLIIFTFTFIVYLVFLYNFLKPISKRYICAIPEARNVLFMMLLFLFTLFLISNYSFWEFLSSRPIHEWPLYRYEALQGRDPFFRILKLGVTPLFLFCAFYCFVILKLHRYMVGVMILVYLFIMLSSGGRSSLIGLVFFVGTFIYFYFPLIEKKFLRRFLSVAFLLIVAGLSMAIVVTSLFTQTPFETAMVTIFNRVFASADGLYYYMQYDGYESIDSGLDSYFYSFAGVYLKSLFGFEYTNIGQQLTELVVGRVGFAQGANYTVALQVMVVGLIWLPVYLALQTYLVVKMREATPFRSTNQGLMKHLICFSLVLLSTRIIMDLEFVVLRAISIIVVILFVVWPFYIFLKLFRMAIVK